MRSLALFALLGLLLVSAPATGQDFAVAFAGLDDMAVNTGVHLDLQKGSDGSPNDDIYLFVEFGDLTSGTACVVGAGAVDPLSPTPLQWCGGRIETGALAGMVLRAPRSARVGVTQACRPVTDLLTVTRTQGNWVLELDGRPIADGRPGPIAARLATLFDAD